ncbi:MAG: hypothetical protein IKS55_08525 [Oscillospiraceae bacterium]|nr:hypothetical protein [Oscillospiraceae bacterium]
MTLLLIPVKGLLKSGSGLTRARFAVPEESFGLTLILRFFDRCRNRAMPSSAAGSGLTRARFAVPEESFGLTLTLRFFDRCRNRAMPSSATGSGITRFPAGLEAQHPSPVRRV